MLVGGGTEKPTCRSNNVSGRIVANFHSNVFQNVLECFNSGKHLHAFAHSETQREAEREREREREGERERER